MGNFGVEESYDFIKEHISLFPFYFEYSSPLRESFEYLNRLAVICMDFYSKMILLDEEKFKEMPFTKLLKDVCNANKDILHPNITHKECKDMEQTIIGNYISDKYNKEDAIKLKEIFAFSNDLAMFQKSRDLFSDVKSYSIDINCVKDKKALKDIPLCPVIVYFQKRGNNTAYVVKHMNNMPFG